MGAFFGPKEVATKANTQNPKGFWERKDVRKICDSLLHSAGADWWKVSRFTVANIPAAARQTALDEFQSVLRDLNQDHPWVIKEPRLCLLFPVIEPLLDGPVCLHIFRDPVEVARSLERHHDIVLTAGLALWELYNRSAIQASRQHLRILVSHAELMSNPVGTVHRLHQQLSELDVAGLTIPDETAIAEFVSADLHHERAGADVRVANLTLPQAQLFHELETGRILKTDFVASLSEGAISTLGELEKGRLMADSMKRMKQKVSAQADEILSMRQHASAQADELLFFRQQASAQADELGLKVQQISKLDDELRIKERELSKQDDDLVSMRVKLAEQEHRLTLLRRHLNDRDAEAKYLRDELATWEERASASDRRLGAMLKLPSVKMTRPLRLIRYFGDFWRLPKRYRHRGFKLAREFIALRESPEFDEAYYLSQNADVAAAGIDPLAHYLVFGGFEGRDPNPRFDSASYLERHPDLMAAGINPLVHYLRTGRRSVAKAGQHVMPIKKKQANRPSAPAVEGSLFQERIGEITGALASQQLLSALRASEADIDAIVGISICAGGPLVSIVMPTHNRARIIHDAIRSVIEQDYENWELLVCDDGSTDDTQSVVAEFSDPRIVYISLPKGGAARARNAGLASAKGGLIAYLDSDNIWNPRYLSCMVATLNSSSGQQAAYANFLDISISIDGAPSKPQFGPRPFNSRALLERPFIDLNGFVHRRELFTVFGGFNDQLNRRQDYDLILKYAWLRDPLYVDCLLVLYQRIEGLQQITHVMKSDEVSLAIIENTIGDYYRSGLPHPVNPQFKSITVLSWDICRNHFSKAFAVAEAFSAEYRVQLIGFRFFPEGEFIPLRNEQAAFECLFFDGSDFPEFSKTMAAALAKIDGDVIYVVKPRLPSLGLALLANYHYGKPIVLEANDLETVVSNPKASDQHRRLALNEADPRSERLLCPYGDDWSALMDGLAAEMPVIMTHNKNLHEHYGRRGLYMRNVKNEAIYNPVAYDRRAIRAKLGFSDDDRVILFGGLVRAHKGVFELLQLQQRLGDPRYKLLIAGSRITADQEKLTRQFGDRVTVLPPQGPAAMARANLAADLVVLWLNPDVPASHFQMPYKITDAFAMNVPVIANGISDLADLGAQGFLRLVPFADWDAMVEAVRQMFDEREKTAEMVSAARALYLRQFSYSAARANAALALEHVRPYAGRTLPAAIEFADWFAEFTRFGSVAESETNQKRQGAAI